jgi:hypothetical protein
MSAISKLCPRCKGLTSAGGKRCAHCGLAFEAQPSCPLCGRWQGDRKLRIRKIGREHTLGVPLLGSVTYNEVDDSWVATICRRCSARVFRARFTAWLLTLTPASALLVIAGRRHEPLLWSCAALAAVATFGFVYYGPFDAWLFGSRVLRRVGIPRGGRHEVPANGLTMLLRAVIGAVVLFVVAAAAASYR